MRVGRAGLVLVGAAVAAVALGWYSGGRPARFEAEVVSVSDGDTVTVRYRDGRQESVRILGVDTPETHHPTVGLECFGPEAEAFTRQRLTGRSVGVEFEVETHDRFGRRLAHLYVDGERFSDELLRGGYAEAFSLPPNEQHARAHLALELTAREQSRGMWGACPTSR